MSDFWLDLRLLPYFKCANNEGSGQTAVHDKTNKMTYAVSKDSDQPGYLPSLIRVLAVRLKKVQVLSYPLSTQQRLCPDWADTQADLSLRWAHIMQRLIFQDKKSIEYC